MMLGRTGVGTSTHGTLYELDAIAAVVVGGTLLVGGRGTIIGTVLGVLIFSTLTNVFTQNNLSTLGAGRREGRHHRHRGAAAAAVRGARVAVDLASSGQRPAASGLARHAPARVQRAVEAGDAHRAAEHDRGRQRDVGARAPEPEHQLAGLDDAPAVDAR